MATRHGAPASHRADECARTLSAALRANVAEIALPEFEECSSALVKLHDGCDWVGPNAPAIPLDCNNVLRGKLPARTRCRSSLECQGTLRCQGVSASNPGLCGSPLEHGAECGAGVDPLASLLRQELLEEEHPECSGHCERRRCTAPISPGGRCSASVQCPINYHCERQRCQPGPLDKLGEGCSGLCDGGARCLKGRCVLPLPEGATCEVDAQCLGACRHGDTGTGGSCAHDCARH